MALGWLYVISNFAISACYLAMAGSIARALVMTRQVRENPLATTMMLIFLFAGIERGMHGVIAIQAHEPVHLGLVAIDWMIAMAAGWYWTLKQKHAPLARGAVLYEDIRVRQKQALEIHDNIVQGLATAKLAMDLQEDEKARNAVYWTLDATRRIITGLLLVTHDDDLDDQVRRNTPAGPPEQQPGVDPNDP